jgi:ribose/xylose/arabinose/galactoside ABC-type transport system permease subunit
VAPSFSTRTLGSLKQWSRRHQGKLSLLTVIVLLGAIASAESSAFLTWLNFKNILLQVSVTGILACGMTMLMVSGGIDLSVGSSVSFSGMAMGGLMQKGTSPVLAVMIGIALAAAVGAANGTLASFTRSHPFIVTLGTLTLVQGAATLISQTPYNNLPDRFLNLTNHSALGLSVVIVIFLVVALTVHIVLATTTFGRRLYAIGGAEGAARLAGIRIRAVKIVVYTLNGILVGIASTLLVAQLSAAEPMMGQGLELAAIAAVAVGGTPLAGGRGDIPGTLMGVLLLGVIANALNLLGINQQWQYVLQGLVIIVAVMAQRSK